MLNLCIVTITVLYVNAMCRDFVIANLEAETSVAKKQKTEGICGKRFLSSLLCRQNFMVTLVTGWEVK